MQELKLNEIQDIHVFGRTDGSLCPLTLFWSGSGIELNLRASELWIELEADYEQYEPWISVLVDGALVSRQMVQKGRHWVPLLRNMSKDSERNIKILRELQPMQDDSSSFLQIHALRMDGEFCPIEQKNGKIEFIGDSLTSGEGLIGAKKEMDWISMVFSASKAYPFLTAEALNTDYRVVSQSGWGVLSGWDGDQRHRIPEYYDQVCGVLKGIHNRDLGAEKPYNFSAWKPDAVVINLGTNDSCAFHQPAAFPDLENGGLFAQKINQDGTLEKASAHRLEKAMIDFLVQVRQKNPQAHIFWAYGMMQTDVDGLIQDAVRTYQRQSDDQNVSLLKLPTMTEEQAGSRQHPGPDVHRKAAEVLTQEIRPYLKKFYC